MILQELEDSESKFEALRQMLTDGENSGTTEYSYEGFIAELDKEGVK